MLVSKLPRSLRWTLGLLFLAVAPLAAQEPAERFASEAQVTAVDLVATVANFTGAIPNRLEPTAFRVTEAGQPVPVLSVGKLGTGTGAEPWRIVLYFDLPMASRGTAQAVALQLGERAARLVQLGSVEIVVADPLPQVFLAPTRNAGELEAALAAFVLEPGVRDELGEVRRTAIAAVSGKPLDGGEGEEGKLPSDISFLEVGQAAVAEECEIIERSLAGLLTWSAEHAGGGPRALIWVGSGFDLDPAVFHRRYLEEEASQLRTERSLAAYTSAAAQAVAGYGWTVFPLSFTDLAPLTSKPSAEFEEFRQRALFGPSVFGNVLPLIKVPLRKKAKAQEVPLFDSPDKPLIEVASESGGRPVLKARELDGLLASLDQSFRVTVQVERRLDGSLRPVRVESASAALSASGRGWVRSGTPEAVAQARARRILAGEVEIGDLALAARLTREGSGEATEGQPISARLTLTLDLARKGSRPATEAGKTLLRLTFAHGKEGEAPTFEHRLLEEQNLAAATWSHGLPITLPAGTEYLLVLLEDVPTGSWGARDVAP